MLHGRMHRRAASEYEPAHVTRKSAAPPPERRWLAAAPAAPALIRGLVAIAAAICDACVPLLERHGKLSDPKRLAKYHAVLRPFLFNPSLLTVRRSHGEAARRHHHDLGAL